MSTFELQPIPGATNLTFDMTFRGYGSEIASGEGQAATQTSDVNTFEGPAYGQTAYAESGMEGAYISSLGRKIPEVPPAPRSAELIQYPVTTPSNNEQLIDTEGFYGAVDETNNAVQEIDDNLGRTAETFTHVRVLFQEIFGTFAQHAELATIARDEVVADAAATVRNYDASVTEANSLLRSLTELRPEYEMANRVMSIAEQEYKSSEKSSVEANEALLRMKSNLANDIAVQEAIIEKKSERLAQLQEYLYNNNSRGEESVELTHEERLEYIIKSMRVKVEGWDEGNYAGSNHELARVHALLAQHVIPQDKARLQEYVKRAEALIAQQQQICNEAEEKQRQKLSEFIEKEEKFAEIARKNRRLDASRRNALNTSADNHARIDDIARRGERIVSPEPEDVLAVVEYIVDQLKDQVRRTGRTDITAIDVPTTLSHPALRAKQEPTPSNQPELPQYIHQEGKVAAKGLLSAVRRQFEIRIDGSN